MKIGAVKVGEFDLDFNGRKLMHFEYLIDKRNWEILGSSRVGGA